MAMLALREIEAGILDSASSYLNRCLDELELSGAFSPAHVTAFLVRGRLTLARGQRQQAILEFEEMLARFEEVSVRWLVADAYYYRAQALLALGQDEEGRESLLQARTAAEALNARRILWQILAALAETEDDPVLAQQALQIANYIGDHTGAAALRAAFLALPEVKALNAMSAT